MPHIARTRIGTDKPNYALLWRAVAAQDASRTVRLLTDAGANTADLWADLTGERLRAVNGKWIAQKMAARLATELQRDDFKIREATRSRWYRRQRSMCHVMANEMVFSRTSIV